MTPLQLYLLWSRGYATYTLGLQHGRGDRRWRSVGLALVTVGWPAALAYGLYAAHSERRKTQRRPTDGPSVYAPKPSSGATSRR